MDGFLKNIGFMAICFVVIYGYTKIKEYNDMKRVGFYENNKVYKAAEEFAQGASNNDVINLLTDCFDFDETDADQILAKSMLHKTDRDGGYREFIKAVNEVLGADIYSEQSHAY